jgi:hypothetical protein
VGVGEAEGKMVMCSGLFWWRVGVNVVFQRGERKGGDARFCRLRLGRLWMALPSCFVASMLLLLTAQKWTVVLEAVGCGSTSGEVWQYMD